MLYRLLVNIEVPSTYATSTIKAGTIVKVTNVSSGGRCDCFFMYEEDGVLKEGAVKYIKDTVLLLGGERYEQSMEM